MAVASPSGTMKISAATLSTVAQAATALALIQPAKIDMLANASVSVK